MLRLLYSNLEYGIIILSNRTGSQPTRLFSFAKKLHIMTNPKHNDRRFALEHSEHIDTERAKQNIYGIVSTVLPLLGIGRRMQREIFLSRVCRENLLCHEEKHQGKSMPIKWTVE